MTYKPSSKIEVAGHTDNVGSAKKNKALSQKRAESCRLYLVGKGVDASRIRAVGHGQARPVASNKTEDGRSKNRRIEARELGGS
jgi:OOP family OmpA-OmpF porin